LATDVEHRAAARLGPFGEDIAEILERIAPLGDGAIADYIPELGKADRDWFGVAVATIDGAVHEAGDSGLPFTIQSISKPFVYGLALEEQGPDEVRRRVGVEPTGDAFNSIEIDEVSLRPFNPMVNAGAIVTAGMVRGDEPSERLARVMGFLSAFAGHELGIDDDVFRSERDCGDRNRAIAYFMRAHGMLDDVEEVLDLYFRQCSVLVNCRDLAVMAATLANGGVNPLTGTRALHPTHVESVLSVMATCGMYDYAGEWLHTVGLPAKSGVAGGIIAVLPGQLGIGVFSPPLDARGNSVRGIAVCEELSRRFHLHQYRPGLISTNAVQRRYSGDVVRARRTRSPDESRVLDREGHRIAVYELRGELSFGPVERLVRTVMDDLDGVDHVVLDFRRARVDAVSSDLVERLAALAAARGVRLIAAHLEGASLNVETAADADEALQRCEENLLAGALGPREALVVPLAEQPLLAGLGAAEIADLATAAVTLTLAPGDVLCREGETAQDVYFLSSGALRTELASANGGPSRRLLTMGPGTALGEIALLDGGLRSATIVADEPSQVRAISFAALAEIGAAHPGFTATLYANLGRMLASRLRRATEQVRALEH
jgi:glutaminase